MNWLQKRDVMGNTNLHNIVTGGLIVFAFILVVVVLLCIVCAETGVGIHDILPIKEVAV